MKKTVYCFVFILMNTPVLFSQDSTENKNSITIEYGLHHLAMQDLIFSPFILKDVTPLNIGIIYKHENRFLNMAEIYFNSFDPVYLETFKYYSVPDSDTLETIRNDFTHVKINFVHGKEWVSTEKYSWYLGAASENTVHAQYYYAGYFGTFGYFASFGLSAWSQFEYRLNDKHQFTVAAHFPLAAWVARSPYLANDDEFIQNISSHSGIKTFFAYLEDGSLQTLEKLQQINLKLNYEYVLNNRWDIGASYQFNFIHYSKPLNLLYYQNGLNINAAFHF